MASPLVLTQRRKSLSAIKVAAEAGATLVVASPAGRSGPVKENVFLIGELAEETPRRRVRGA